MAEPDAGAYDGVVLAVAHRQFKAMDAASLREFGRTYRHVLYDLKNVLPREVSDLRL